MSLYLLLEISILTFICSSWSVTSRSSMGQYSQLILKLTSLLLRPLHERGKIISDKPTSHCPSSSIPMNSQNRMQSSGKFCQCVVWIYLSELLLWSVTKKGVIVLLFCIPYVLLQPPATVVLRKVGPRIFLPTITLLWGITMICFGFVKDWYDLVPLRLILGIFEAGFFPGRITFLGSHNFTTNIL